MSSGIIQFAVHVCPIDGAMLSAEMCKDHEKTPKSSCCDEMRIQPKADDCCSEGFVFAVSAKFGSILCLNLLPQDFVDVTSYIQTEFSSIYQGSAPLYFKLHHDPPITLGRDVLQSSQKLII
jgi:hypothetical protein